MPVANLPLSLPSQSNVTLEPAIRTSALRLLSIALLPLAALMFLVTIRLATRKREHLPTTRSPSTKSGSSGAQQLLWASEKRSRGVSNRLLAATMSASQRGDFSQLGAENGSDHGQYEESPEWSPDGVYEDVANPFGPKGVMPRTLKGRPPPPPPLTPPTLSAGVFKFEDRRLSVAVSTMGELDSSFFSQPNPDYTSSEPSPSIGATSSEVRSAMEPRRRSYTKMIPVGLPPKPVPFSDEHSANAYASSSAMFSPSSFPSSSPILPLAPHDSFEDYQQHQQLPQQGDRREIDVQGEIISVMDDSGAGWKRHTRVYGGGVCLACLASGGTGNGHGGFYGDKVRPEERR